jgi:hypothetical protein
MASNTRRVYLNLTAANEQLRRFGLELNPADVKALVRRVYRRNGSYQTSLEIPNAPLDRSVLPHFHPIPIGHFTDVGLFDTTQRHTWKLSVMAESGAAVHSGMASSWSVLCITCVGWMPLTERENGV